MGGMIVAAPGEESKLPLFRMLRCPLCGARLRPASAEECAGARRSVEGDDDESWDGGLVDESGVHFYPVQDGIPLVIGERAITLA